MLLRPWFFLLLCMPAAAGCRKFVQVSPPDTQLQAGVIFSSDPTATAAMMGVYSRAMASPGLMLNGAGLYLGLSADELSPTLATAAIVEFSNNTLSSGNVFIATLYGSAYNTIYNCNTMLENLVRPAQLSAGTKRQLQGEALFMRALSYSRLAALFGPVPLETTTNPDVNARKARTSLAGVYQQVITDLQLADSLLDSSYVTAPANAGERTRANRWAARALLARMHLYMGEYGAADSAASAVIGAGMYILEPSLDSVFSINSREGVFQLQPVSSFMNSAEAFYFLPADNAQAKPNYVLTPSLLDAFEAGDQRRDHWTATKAVAGVSYTYPYKYKARGGPPYTEYNMVLRLAEQYLIRAEARAQGNDPAGAAGDLNVIRLRAGLPGLPAGLSVTQALAAVQQERRIELLTEWGHRWTDLKRTGQIDTVMKTVKTGWQSNAALYPIPLFDMQRDSKLVQNAGY